MTDPHNFGRISAPGLVMDVGSIRKQLARYEECDSFLSADAGLSWNMAHKNVYMYEFGDSGSILVIVNDEEMTDCMSYSTDFGATWKSFKLGLNIRARGLTTVSDSTSQKFMLLAQDSQGHYAVMFLDFAPTWSRQCGDNDFEQCYTHSRRDKECLMGVKQWYNRRKPDANCCVGASSLVQSCTMIDAHAKTTTMSATTIMFGATMSVPAGLECIPSTMCTTGKADEKYMGSSGYRLIAGNRCDPGTVPRKTIPCRSHVHKITNQIHNFEAKVVQHHFFKDLNTILTRLSDNTIWQSSNEGFTWTKKFPGECFLTFYMHTHANRPAYLITDSDKFFYTTDGGPVLQFQPCSDYLIWVGSVGDNGRSRNFIEDYIVNCDWARDDELLVDWMQIICESYRNKQGSQSAFGRDNALQLILGRDYFDKKTKLFEHVVGFTKFSEFLIVAEADVNALDLQVALDGRTFAAGQFPPGMHPNTHAYTVLESSTGSIFLHMTMSEWPNPFWGNLLKSNSNGTYFGLSIENVNRNDIGFIDFEKLVGLDGIVMVNIVANPAEATLSRSKVLQTRITHNDAVAHTSSIFAQGRMNVETICQLEFNHLMPKSMILLWNGLDKEPEKGRSIEELEAPDFSHSTSTHLICHCTAEKDCNAKPVRVRSLVPSNAINPGSPLTTLLLSQQTLRSIEEFDAPDFRRNASTDLIRQRAAEKEHNREAIKHMQFTFSLDRPSPVAVNVAVSKLVLKPTTAFKETITRRRRLTLTSPATKLMVAPATSTSRRRLPLDPGSTKNYGSSNEKPFSGSCPFSPATLACPLCYALSPPFPTPQTMGRTPQTHLPAVSALFAPPSSFLWMSCLAPSMLWKTATSHFGTDDYKILVNSDIVMQGSPNLHTGQYSDPGATAISVNSYRSSRDWQQFCSRWSEGQVFQLRRDPYPALAPWSLHIKLPTTVNQKPFVRYRFTQAPSYRTVPSASLSMVRSQEPILVFHTYPSPPPHELQQRVPTPSTITIEVQDARPSHPPESSSYPPIPSTRAVDCIAFLNTRLTARSAIGPE
ncbi:hypothetical protein BU15DRAFT_59022 [Melanogaster broomeanus]|nr:hypothetical protein BU15DRAFT_59022 [Melanogaster broomeanus]